MNKLIAAAVLGFSTFATLPVHALTATGAFDVTVNLYPKCEVSIASALVLNYVSFQTSASTNTTAAAIKCTNTLPYTLSIAANSGTLVGLPYTLSAPAGGTGTGSAVNVNITGTIAANEGGTCASDSTATTTGQTAAVTGATTGAGVACSATSAANAHVLTVTY